MSKQLARTVVNGFNMQAALLSPAHAEIIVDSFHSLAQANAKEENEQAKGNANELVAAYGYAASPVEKPFAYADGIAFISISGVLINRFNWSWGFVTGYNFIRNQLNAALADDDVKGIVFDVNSGGGQVAGCFELANDIYNSRAIKPSIAVVDAFAYSAAYALASSATKVLVTPSGNVGSIGAVMMHMDWSQYMKEEGIKVTFIYSGDHKKDGNPYETLPESVRADMQASVDIARKEFVDLVSRNRSLDSQVIHDTQARCYRASEAIELGLIDGITTPTDAVISFLNELEGSVTIEKEIDMSTKTNQPGAESETTVTSANAASATPAAQPAAAVDTQAQDHRQAERTRIQGILGCDEAKEKQALANHLAMNTELSVDAAKGILAAASSEVKPQAAAANANPLEAAMATTTNPEVGADGGNNGVQVEQSAAARILAAQALATGEKLV
jgi:signal peptide peptidase SppA